MKIKRTDGHVHPAVAKINDACNSLIVEWCERGDTKGKDVDLDAILRVIPKIVSSPAELLEQQEHSASEPRKLATQLTASSVTISFNIGRYHTMPVIAPTASQSVSAPLAAALNNTR